MQIEMTEGLKQYRLELIKKSAEKLSHKERKEVQADVPSAGYEEELNLTKEEKELCGII